MRSRPGGWVRRWCMCCCPLTRCSAGTCCSGTRAGRAAPPGGLGLLLAVGTAFVPLVYVLVAVLGGAAAWLLRGARPGVLTSAGIALAVPVALLLPWLVDQALDPGRLLLEAGLHGPALSDARLGPESLLALNPGGPGVPPFWVTAGLVAAGLAALLARRRRRAVAAGWAAALFAMLVAVVIARITVSGATAWPGVPLALAAAALIVLAGLSAPGLAALGAAGGVRRMAAVLVAAVAISAPLLAAGHWVVQGVRGPLRSDVPDPTPPAGRDPRAARRADPARQRFGVHLAARPGPAPRRGGTARRPRGPRTCPHRRGRARRRARRHGRRHARPAGRGHGRHRPAGAGRTGRDAGLAAVAAADEPVGSGRAVAGGRDGHPRPASARALPAHPVAVAPGRDGPRRAAAGRTRPPRPRHRPRTLPPVPGPGRRPMRARVVGPRWVVGRSRLGGGV
ncbi:hypothetical protein ACFSTC_49245 [Nonomuraea ferruginea]